MNDQIKLILAVAAAAVLAAAAATIVSNVRLRSLERNVEIATERARTLEETAREAESRAAEHKQKIEYLEAEIAGIGRIARKQDEELKKISGDIGNARSDVERAKRIRTVGTTAAELCGKLEELGYPCETRR
ncbi:MAG: hypothetical protein KIT61_12515 [Pyrinomonadaceae bacterium]|nr:hypothetical protein [Pyrinomonadaceae bacterium]